MSTFDFKSISVISLFLITLFYGIMILVTEILCEAVWFSVDPYMRQVKILVYWESSAS
jgi:hypothetical protein